jgi:hypothetical protein|tara:strand:- start:394 stop:942 length:549 start_codon:yes stop_codon:yes gene_type:complete
MAYLSGLVKVYMSLRYTFRSETTTHKFVFGKRSVAVKELKQHIMNNHRGVKNVSIISIVTQEELDDSILLSRGSNVQVKRTISDFESVDIAQQPIQSQNISNPKTLAGIAENARQKREYLNRRQVIVRKKRKYVQQKLEPPQKIRGIPNRFVFSKMIKDDSHLKEDCIEATIPSRGDAQLKL